MVKRNAEMLRDRQKIAYVQVIPRRCISNGEIPRTTVGGRCTAKAYLSYKMATATKIA